MLIGPVFTREATTACRRVQFYAMRTVFAAVLFGLMLTAWQILIGTGLLEGPGAWARFGSAVFQILAPLLVAVALPFSALLVAAAVAQEKDRKTLILLLMTRLTNSELVVGKLLAGMLNVLVAILAAFPILMLTTLLGGVSYGQVLRVLGVSIMSGLAGGSLGSLVALWREKTFQALAVTSLLLVVWLLLWEIAASGAFAGVGGLSAEDWQRIAVTMSPWQAVQAAAAPELAFAAGMRSPSDSIGGFLLAAGIGTILINLLAIAMVRVWNPSRETRRMAADAEDDAESVQVSADGQAVSAVPVRDIHSAGGSVREVWDNPILWREVRTWAHGRKIVIVRLAYLLFFAVCAIAVWSILQPQGNGAYQVSRSLPAVSLPMVPLLTVSLLLVNALAVTSLTSERDSKALDLLLVSDLTPSEIIYGKLLGAFYNGKETILLPLLLVGYLWWNGALLGESFWFLVIGVSTLFGFAATLGLHTGMTYVNSRSAIATSLGTLLFLFLGVATCMRIMLAFDASFENQLLSFLGVVLGGGVALYGALGLRNPSPAMALAFIPAPFFTFFAMTSFLLGQYGTVFLLTVMVYGFAIIAMLKPAIAEFDVATGRTLSTDIGES